MSLICMGYIFGHMLKRILVQSSLPHPETMRVNLLGKHASLSPELNCWLLSHIITNYSVNAAFSLGQDEFFSMWFLLQSRNPDPSPFSALVSASPQVQLGPHCTGTPLLALPPHPHPDMEHYCTGALPDMCNLDLTVQGPNMFKFVHYEAWTVSR